MQYRTSLYMFRFSLHAFPTVVEHNIEKRKGVCMKNLFLFYLLHFLSTAKGPVKRIMFWFLGTGTFRLLHEFVQSCTDYKKAVVKHFSIVFSEL